MDLTLEENDVMEYMQGQVAEPPENFNANVIYKYKKGEIKAKKLIIDSLRGHFITYVSKSKKSEEMYDKLIGMYEVYNLTQVMKTTWL